MPPPTATACTPGAFVTRFVPSAADQRHTWTSVGSSEAANQTSSPVSRTAPVCTPGRVTGLPSIASRYVSAARSATISTIRPSSRRAGTPR